MTRQQADITARAVFRQLCEIARTEKGLEIVEQNVILGARKMLLTAQNEIDDFQWTGIRENAGSARCRFLGNDNDAASADSDGADLKSKVGPSVRRGRVGERVRAVIRRIHPRTGRGFTSGPVTEGRDGQAFRRVAVGVQDRATNHAGISRELGK